MMFEKLFRLLDSLIEKIVPLKRARKLDRLVPHKDAVAGDSEELVETDWSREWKPSV